MAHFPALEFTYVSISNFPVSFESYFKDHFGFRNTLIHIYNKLKVDILNVSSNYGVLLGKHEWSYLFPTQTREDFFGKIHITSKVYAWIKALELFKEWLADRGARYYFVIAPEKQMIYPENLPSWVAEHAGKTVRMQLAQYMVAHSGFDFIDLTNPLIHQKSTKLNYYKNDSHWNSIGASQGAKTILSRIAHDFPDTNILDSHSPDLEPYHDQYQGDLTKYLGIPNSRTEDLTEYRIKNRCSKRSKLLPLKAPYREQHTVYTCPTGNLTALIIHDSFGYALRKFLAEKFKQSVFVSYIDYKDISYLLESIKPDIIIDLRVERNLSVTLDSILENVNSIYSEKLSEFGSPFFRIQSESIQSAFKNPHKLRVNDGKTKLGFTTEPGESWIDVKIPQTDSPILIHLQMYAVFSGYQGVEWYGRNDTSPLRREQFFNPMTNTSRFIAIPAEREDHIRLSFNSPGNEWMLEKFDVYKLK